MSPPDGKEVFAESATARHVKYSFFGTSRDALTVDLAFDARTYQLLLPASAEKPDWARLECNRCPNCTLADDAGYCPAALGMASFLPAFSGRKSYEKEVIEVETSHRTIVARTTLQSGLASLIGLICATSGCPRTLFLRPMARFHLPFADEQETLFRSFSTWLLMAFIQQRMSGHGTVSLDGLKHHYQELQVVNAALAERLRTIATSDALLNGVIILDLFAQIAPDNIDGEFEDIVAALAVED